MELAVGLDRLLIFSDRVDTILNVLLSHHTGSYIDFIDFGLESSTLSTNLGILAQTLVDIHSPPSSVIY